MKVRMRIGLTAWICDSNHSTPRKVRSISLAWKIQREAVWSKRAQNIATKRKRIESVPMVLRPFGLKVSFRNRLPLGGT